MGYIGNEAQTAFTSFDKQTITGTGTSVYTLSHSVANEQEIEVFVNNVRQEGGSGKAYTVSGNQITFSEHRKHRYGLRQLCRKSSSDG